MINIIYSEFIKLKKSSTLFLVLAGGLAMPILMDISTLVLRNKNRTFGSYSFNIQGITYVMLYGILFSVMAGKIFTREYNDKTAGVLYTYPCSRNQIFIAKFIVICTLIFLTCFIQAVAVYIGYYVLFGSLDYNLVFNDIKANVGAVLFQIAIIPIPIFLVNLKKNMILPIVFGLFTLCNQMIIPGFDYVQIKYNPLVGTFYLFNNLYGQEAVDIKCTIIAACICFIISLIVSMYQHSRTDMI